MRRIRAAASLFIDPALGVPVSTTHTITGSIMGSGVSEAFDRGALGVAGKILWAWILDHPLRRRDIGPHVCNKHEFLMEK